LVDGVEKGAHGALGQRSGRGRDHEVERPGRWASLARDLRLGQIMVERGLTPAPAALANPATRLKALLR
jgi:hypothetical protein